ncbi:MAG TPA: hypothetical protein V6C58_11975 [Allocoleopsis sp.]
MYSQDQVTQVTFHYDNGHSDSYIIPVSSAEFQQQIPGLFKRPWLIFHLYDQSETIFISTNKLVKIEVKPALMGFKGEGIYADSERVTALTRTGR